MNIRVFNIVMSIGLALFIGGVLYAIVYNHQQARFFYCIDTHGRDKAGFDACREYMP